MNRRKNRDVTAWRGTATGLSLYATARAAAQTRANVTGLDVGLEANDLFETWTSFLLPAPASRNGHELRCEVVRPENWALASRGVS